MQIAFRSAPGPASRASGLRQRSAGATARRNVKKAERGYGPLAKQLAHGRSSGSQEPWFSGPGGRPSGSQQHWQEVGRSSGSQEHWQEGGRSSGSQQPWQKGGPSGGSQQQWQAGGPSSGSQQRGQGSWWDSSRWQSWWR